MRKLFGLMLAGCILTFGATAAAADSIPAATQSYNADSSVLPGMIVELKPKVSATVMPLLSQDVKKMLGVVVPINGEPLVLTSPSSSGQQVLVATSGQHDVLVSNQAGVIRPGDYVTISSLSGIGMKAGTAQPEVIGQAIGGFNGSANVLGSVPLQKSAGGSVNEAIGSIAVAVHPAPNPDYKQPSSGVPNFLAKAASDVAGKHVSTVRIYMGAFMMVATLFISGSMLSSGVKGEITAVGRNPLAKKSIRRSLLQIVLIGLMTFITGALLTYLILNL